MLSIVEAPKHRPSKVETLWVQSQILAQNPANVAPIRPVSIYLPKEAQTADKPLPVVYGLAPWTSAGRQQFDWQAFKESLADRLDRLIAKGLMQPAIVVCPDLYTDFGGSQYVNSTFLGRHADFLIEELIPFIEQHYPVAKGPSHRAVFGRSSGGFGALRLAMDFPDQFAAVACHSGDMGFDTTLRPSLLDLGHGLARYRDDVQRFLRESWEAPKLGGREVHLLMLFGLAASYSPNLDHALGFDLPIDLYDGSLRDDVWQRWLKHDPVEMVVDHAEALRKLKLLYLDCGNRDQYHLHFGARQLVQKLKNLGVNHRYEEFDDNHSGTAYRFDVSLPKLVEACT